MNGVSKLEFLCDAIAEYAGSHDPRSEAYKFRNPLALTDDKAVGENGHKIIQRGKLRKFRSWVHGYEAGLYDLRRKCEGRNPNLTQYSSLADLTVYYGMKDDAGKRVADYLSFALEDEKITEETKLFIFLR